MFRHLVLLALRAVVLDGENQGELGREESVRLYSIDQDLFEVQLGGQRPAVVDDGLGARAIPTIWKKISEE